MIKLNSILFILVFISCSTLKLKEQAEEPPVVEVKTQEQKIDYNSIDFSDIVNRLNFRIPAPDSKDTLVILTDTTNIEYIWKSDSAVIFERETMPGFRVQIFANENISRANEVYNRAIFKFKERVYLEYEAPNYKIRVGNCKTRAEATRLQIYIRENGFPDAWIIRTNIDLFPQTETKLDSILQVNIRK